MWLAIGLVIGGVVGFMMCAVLTSAKRADEHMERSKRS